MSACRQVSKPMTAKYYLFSSTAITTLIFLSSSSNFTMLSILLYLLLTAPLHHLFAYLARLPFSLLTFFTGVYTTLIFHVHLDGSGILTPIHLCNSSWPRKLLDPTHRSSLVHTRDWSLALRRNALQITKNISSLNIMIQITNDLVYMKLMLEKRKEDWAD